MVADGQTEEVAMTLAMPVSIVTLVIGFLIAALTQFPTPGASATLGSVPADQLGYKEGAEEVGQRFNSAYFGVIEDLMSYAKDPDLARVERQEAVMKSYAEALGPQFQGLATRLTQQLNEETAEGEAAAQP